MQITKHILYDYCDLLYFAEENQISDWNGAIKLLKNHLEFEHNVCWIYKGEVNGDAGRIIDGYLDLIGKTEAQILYT